NYRGKVVVIVFWATWCAPCRAMFPEEKALVEKFADKQFALLGVNGDGDRDEAKKVAKDEQLSWPSFWDGKNGPIAEKWHVDGWPAVYILDEKGVIQRKYNYGPMNGYLERDVDTLLAKMKKEKEPSPVEAKPSR